MEPKLTMSPEEAAEMLQCSVEHVNLLCRQGKIKAKKPFGRWVINAQHVKELAGVTGTEAGEQNGTEHQGTNDLDI
jgi:excisionase family DNA binding protein